MDEIPLLSMGYGMSAAADGRWFPYVFNFPTSYWSQASAFIRFIGEQEGGIENLAGKNIGLIYLESGYGREPIPLFEALGEKYGYTFTTYSVPGKEMQKQQAQWRKIDRDKTRLAVHVGLGRHEPDGHPARHRVRLSARPFHRRVVVGCGVRYGDRSASWPRGTGPARSTPPGQCCDVHKDIVANVYDQGGGTDKDTVGQVLYNRVAS